MCPPQGFKWSDAVSSPRSRPCVPSRRLKPDLGCGTASGTQQSRSLGLLLQLLASAVHRRCLDPCTRPRWVPQPLELGDMGHPIAVQMDAFTGRPSPPTHMWMLSPQASPSWALAEGWSLGGVDPGAHFPAEPDSGECLTQGLCVLSTEGVWWHHLVQGQNESQENG